MITLDNVFTRWDGFTIEDINLKINEGEYFVILGPTGAGKTLLLELIAGFWEPDKGVIEMFGKDVTQIPPEEREVGFVYQDYMLFPHLNVKENIAFGLRLKNVHPDKITDRVNTIVKTLGIYDLLDRDVSTLSGGEAQRVALARALVLKPRVLLLDEPLSALDPNVQDKVRGEIKKIHKRFGITIIHITHNREEAMILGDRIAVMGKGKIYQVGVPAEIFRRPASHFVAEFVGVQNILTGNIKKKGRIEIKGLTDGVIFTSSSMTGKAKLAIRPEDIIISPKKITTSARNVLRGKVISMVDKGTVMSVEVDAGQPITAYITRESLENLNITLGQHIYLVFKAQNVHLFQQ